LSRPCGAWIETPFISLVPIVVLTGARIETIAVPTEDCHCYLLGSPEKRCVIRTLRAFVYSDYPQVSSA
jgi:hypothetical protein